MSEKVWTLQEIRSAYGDVLKLYNEVFPLHPRERKPHEETWPDFNIQNSENLNGDEEGLL